MNTTDAPTQPLECLDNWIKRTAIMSSSLTAYTSSHDPRFFYLIDNISMNSDIPTQPLDCLEHWITRTLVRCSSLTTYISERNNLSDLIEDVAEMQMYMYAAKHYIGLIKTDQISLK